MSLTLNLFGNGPKWTFQCDCGYAWRERLIPGIDRPRIICPACKEDDYINIEWGRRINNY